MRQRLKLFLIAANLLLAGLTLAQEPPEAQPDDPPVRLKKKKSDPGKTEPAQPEKKTELPKKDKEAPKEDPEPPAPQEDEAEVLARVAKNVRLAEEKLSNKELNDATRQLQEDILKDLDSLIRAAENPPGGGGGGEDQNPDPSSNPDQSKSSSKSQSGTMSKQAGGKSSGRSSRAMRRSQGTGSQQANKGGKPQNQNQQGEQGSQQADGKNNNGNNGGGGGKPMPGTMDKNADLYKDVWGHLPEALRAEMNAYSNDKQFMAKYDELIKRYYRTIAEQGRRKGD